MLVDGSGGAAASVVVPAYRAKDTIGRCLSALVAQDTDLEYEVIVVDSSGDGTGEVVAGFPGVQFIQSPTRLYAGAARNLGAERASGELLLFIDSDCIAESRWIQKMRQNHRDRDCSAVAGSILNGNPESIVSMSSYMNEFSHFFPVGRPRYVRYLPSGNLSYKADVFRRYGGFDPNEPAYEDLIFNTVLSKAGEKLLFDPGIRVSHLHRTNLMEYLAHEFRRGRGAAVARKRGLMIGSSWMKSPVLAMMAMPGLFLRKTAVFPYRLVKAHPASHASLYRVLPCFWLALAVWNLGFLVEAASGRHRSGDGEQP